MRKALYLAAVSLASLFFLLLPSARAQDATVTFYTARPLGDAQKAWGGSVFDGRQDPQRMFEIGRRMFITLHLPAGPHHFTVVADWKHPRGEGSLDIDLTAGTAYFIRLTSTVKIALVPYSENALLASESCGTARLQGDSYKPLPAKYILPSYRDGIAGNAYFPACEARQ
jgi:hypothetical protein